jgi:hypothetical protein
VAGVATSKTAYLKSERQTSSMALHTTDPGSFFFPSTKVDFTISLKNGFLGFWNFDTNGLMNVFDHALVKIKERSNDSIAFWQFEKERT